MRDGDIIGELSWTGTGNHSSALTPSLRLLLQTTGTGIGDIDSIVVCSGPGSFSGLRVGMSAAKGLAMALDRPLVGIPSLDALALAAITAVQSIWAILGAGRGRVYLARYEGTWTALRRTSDYMLTSVAEAAEQVGREAVTGEAAEEIAAALRERGTEAQVLPAPLRLRRSGFLAELGKRYLEEGGTDQRDVLEPLYLRQSAAEEKRAAALQE
jgi:tRNA threonylcarbamoyladenosine biosynthesis protein TsaB